MDNNDERILALLRDREKREQLQECEDSLHPYIKRAWDIIEPGIDYIDNWHIEAICEYLEAVSLGQINRLLINMPPRYMKSIAVTVGWPTWIWIKNPYKRFISLSYSAMLSKKHNMNRRDIIKSPWYQDNWGDRYSLKSDMDTQMKFENDKMGFMFATSIGGTLTGEGGDYIIVDDPHNPTQAQSDTERESAVEFFRTTLPTRLNDKKKGAIVVVMQRLHEEDVSGHCLKEGGYTHLCLPGIAEKREVIHFPISLNEIVREDGDILWPEREDKKELDNMKRTLGSYGFSGQYQQSPSPTEGGTFKKWWWRYWKPKGSNFPPVSVKDSKGNTYNIEAIELPDKFDRKLQSWDLTFKNKEENDYVAGQAWANKGASIFLLDRVSDRWSFTETLKAIETFTTKHPDIILKLIEDKANGPAIIDMLHHKIGGIVPIEPEGSKTARAEAVTPIIEAGNVYLPHPMLYVWVNDIIDQCAKFPKVSHDDDVDCLSQALYRFIYSSNPIEKPKLPDDIPDDLREDLENDPTAMQHYLKERGLI
jgi:predicted phage terminase large subunit-like protein